MISAQSRLVQTFAFTLLLSICSLVQARWFNAAEDIMGTRVSMEFWCEDESQAQDIIQAVMDDMREVEAQLSPYIESSELFRVNRDAAVEPVVISENFFSLLEKSLYYSRISGGAFDVTFASVGHLYDYRNARAPSEEELAKNLPGINYHFLQLDREKLTVAFAHPKVRIDLGGIAKGYAVDRSIAILKARGIQSAIVAAGGDSRILGDRQGTPWIMGIRHPRKPDAYAVRLPLQNSAISTSGDYERFFLDGEVRIHHIIDPHSGKSADAVVSASILAPMAVDSDALSTTVFVLGVEKGLALINSMPGIDAIIIDGEQKMHYSDGLLRAE